MKLYKSNKAGANIIRTYDELIKSWGVEVEEKDVSTTYGGAHVIICGNKALPPLMLFHGVGDDSALMWIYNAKALSKDFSIFAVDTIGGPGKSRPNEKYNKDFDSIKWIDDIMTGLKLDKVYMAGVSNGGLLAQYYGVYRPERVIKIICMAATVPDDSFNPMKGMIKIFLPEALFPTKKNTVKLLRKLTGKNKSVFTDNSVILEHFQALLKGFNNMAMRYHSISGINDEQIDSIRNKVLYLVGDDDPFAKLGGKDSLLRYKMNARFFPETGHGINHEISEEINAIFPAFLLSQA